MDKTNFGIIGLGVMGRSLAKNAVANGISLSVYNRLTEAEKEVIPNFLSSIKATDIQGFTDMELFVDSLALPRKILLMVNAGSAVDAVINNLKPLLSPGDIIIDGGNSNYKDTQLRASKLKADTIHFMGTGISGGEQGALNGPSMMVGGAIEPYKYIQPIFELLAAKDKNNKPCVSHLGTDGCGHFVKTIHNGIEYAEMQLLTECYALLAPTHTNQEISSLFHEWNQGDLSSYLLEITANILVKKDEEGYLLDRVLDKAGSKGTGSWSSQVAFQLGVPSSMINAAVTARYISALKERRVELANLITSNKENSSIDLTALKETYRFSRIINHHQGFEIIKAASIENEWDVDVSEIARIWTQGCIIKSKLMESLVDTFKITPDILNDPKQVAQLNSVENAVTKILNFSFNKRIPINCISNSYNYFISLTTARLPAHLIQAQRDEFGAHTYQRIDRPSTEYFTSNWTSNG